MKSHLLAAFIALIATSADAQVCDLSATDVASLAASPSHLTAQGFQALSPEKQKMVCETRAYIREIETHNGAINDLSDHSLKYESPTENKEDAKASNDYLTRLTSPH
jgi:hypothetical protein